MRCAENSYFPHWVKWRSFGLHRWKTSPRGWLFRSLVRTEKIWNSLLDTNLDSKQFRSHFPSVYSDLKRSRILLGCMPEPELKKPNRILEMTYLKSDEIFNKIIAIEKLLIFRNILERRCSLVFYIPLGTLAKARYTNPAAFGAPNSLIRHWHKSVLITSRMKTKVESISQLASKRQLFIYGIKMESQKMMQPNDRFCLIFTSLVYKNFSVQDHFSHSFDYEKEFMPFFTDVCNQYILKIRL